MRIIISPAKKMKVDSDSFETEGLPQFLDRAEQLKNVLQAKTKEELQLLWNCNDAIAELNWERIRKMDLQKGLTPAIFAYEGIQYRYMAPGVFEQPQFDYLQERLRILSGFYGVLGPFDGITPYRLEMQARLEVGAYKNLYAFWGDMLAQQLAQETDTVLNLASKEYSKAVEAYLPENVRFVTCRFVERKKDRLTEKATACKMARGQMVRWMAEHEITEIEEIKAFGESDYTYSEEESSENRFVYIKGGN